MSRILATLFKTACVIIIACQLIPAQEDSREGDSLALFALAAANSSLGWDDSLPIDTWNGVTAGSGPTDRVTYVSVGNKNMGLLPPEIGNLTKMTSFNLNNNLISEIPPEIETCTELTELSFENNSLSAIPAEIGSLTNLTGLMINGNIISQLPPEIGSLSNLLILWLDNNMLTALPTEMANLTTVTSCTLDKNLLHFDDIELLIGIMDELIYRPQDTIGTAVNDSLVPGLRIGVVVRGSVNHYAWTLDGDSVGEDSDSISVTKEGVYECIITSDSISDPKLKLVHKPITIKGPTPIISENTVIPHSDFLIVSNSCNQVSIISYQLSAPGHVELTVYTTTGKKVTTLVSRQQPSGNYRCEWNGSGMAGGTYFCQLTAGDVVRVKKLLLVE